MTDPDWKQLHANAADETLRHPLVVGVMAELRGNLGVSDDGLPAYGIAKVAHYAAQVARAQALGFDPELLRMTPDEANSAQMELAAAAVFAGVPVTLVDAQSDDVLVCPWCLAYVRPGQTRIIHHTTGTKDDAEVYHSDCWDRKLRAEEPR